ncbi:hypothetical protein BDP27DRAFT_1512224 [Rhodocollybia butyracea]|uniref:Uncharacterized protein n=1 Tax=Rhodocollybia butyracea TaxID=206335 RepID=A0A9P5PXE1_9AGAR|nr:hypothetical protein BDP27DRAFT_1512224 [Rhodocollybia butyracea]
MDKLLGQRRKTTLWNFIEIILESGLLLPLFLGVALAIEVGTTPILSRDSILKESELGYRVLGPCALTQVAAIASTLIIVHIGLGVEVQPSRFPSTKTSNLELAPNREQDLLSSVHRVTRPILLHLEPESAATPTVRGETTIQPFLLKYSEPSPPLQTVVHYESDISPFLLQYNIPPEPSRVHPKSQIFPKEVVQKQKRVGKEWVYYWCIMAQWPKQAAKYGIGNGYFVRPKAKTPDVLSIHVTGFCWKSRKVICQTQAAVLKEAKLVQDGDTGTSIDTSEIGPLKGPSFTFVRINVLASVPECLGLANNRFDF